MAEKNLNHSGDVGSLGKRCFTVKNYLQTLGIKHTGAKIAVTDYELWKKQAMFDRIAGTTVGDSFCEYFDIRDVYLQLSHDSLSAIEQHIQQYYCPELSLTT